MVDSATAQSVQNQEGDVFVYTVPVDKYSHGTIVSVSDYVPFALQLCGVSNIPQVLSLANEMGVTGEDLQILQPSDIETLLPQSKFQQRKFQSICNYVKEGGTLRHGMTMSDIYQNTAGVEAGRTSDQSGGSTLQGSEQTSGNVGQASSEQPTSFAQALDSNVNSTTNTTEGNVISTAGNATPTAPTNNTTSTSQEDNYANSSDGTCAWTNPLTMAGNGMTSVQQQIQQLQSLHRQFTQLMKMVKSCNG